MRESTGLGGDSRAQTLIGFITLVGGFTIAVTVVFALVGAFNTGTVATGVDTTEKASLVSTTLVTDVLAANGSSPSDHPHKLAHGRVVRFFDTDQSPAPDTVAGGDGVNVNVTLEHTGARTPPPAFEGNSTLTAGKSPPAPGATSTQTTQATLDGRQVTVRVKTWP
ncbi:hypothetical protein ACFQDD_00950 [Halorubrum pallidum]|uniref:Flagellin n=1 Tax=Halorubrum pallidum TaxID=1526114 RepID=A0ABD5SYG9_9EURY